MGYVVTPDTLPSVIADMANRISVLENTNPLAHGNFFDLLTSQNGYMSFTDSNGVVRVEIGNLPARGVSPAQFGTRVNDAGGNPIFDTLGLVSSNVIKSIGIVNPPTNQSFTSTTFTGLTGGSISFTNTRTINLLALFVGTGNVSTNNGNVGFLRANLDSGASTSGNENFGVLANFAQTSSGWLWVPNLAPGPHTINLDAAVNATPQTFLLIQSSLQVFQFGS